MQGAHQQLGYTENGGLVPTKTNWHVEISPVEEDCPPAASPLAPSSQPSLMRAECGLDPRVMPWGSGDLLHASMARWSQVHLLPAAAVFSGEGCLMSAQQRAVGAPTTQMVPLPLSLPLPLP